jgi:hypothetical protein
MRDISAHLIEWLSLLQEQKYGKIYMYMYGMHPNVRKVAR